jgi:hypothetical protein
VTFDDAVAFGLKAAPVPDLDPEFVRRWRAVARGELSVEQAWSELQQLGYPKPAADDPVKGGQTRG